MNFGLKFSQLNGVVGDILNSITTWFSNIITSLFAAIFLLLYQLTVVPIMLIVDAIQLLFRKFAGLDTIYVEGEGATGDIVLTLVNNKTIQDVFWSLLILSFVLLIIVTIVLLIKKETEREGKRKTAKQIFADSGRALLNFFMVPVVAVLGIYMGNALLKSLDSATAGGENVRISGTIFKACAYTANRARNSETFANDLASGINSMGIIKGSADNIAEALDSAFVNQSKFGKWMSLDYSKLSYNLFDKDATYIYLAAYTVVGGTTLSLILRNQFSYYDANQVFYYYDLSQFNFILAYIALIFCAWVLLNTSVGLIKRIFKLVILLVISPPIVAISPLDNNGALGKWRGSFLSSTLAAYATIVTLNVTFLILGPLQTIEFFKVNVSTGNGVADDVINWYANSGQGGVQTLNSMIQVLLVCSGLQFFKDFVKEISGFIGAENAYETGVGATKAMTEKIASVVGTAAGMATGAGAITSLKKAGSLLKREDIGEDGKPGRIKKEFDAAHSTTEFEKVQLERLRKGEAGKEELDAQIKKVKDAEKNEELWKNKLDGLNNSDATAKSMFSQLRSKGANTITNGLYGNIIKSYKDNKNIIDKDTNDKKVNPIIKASKTIDERELSQREMERYKSQRKSNMGTSSELNENVEDVERLLKTQAINQSNKSNQSQNNITLNNNIQIDNTDKDSKKTKVKTTKETTNSQESTESKPDVKVKTNSKNAKK